MKKMVRIVAVFAVIASFWGFWGQQSARALAGGLTTTWREPVSVLAVTYRNPADAKLGTEFGEKIDLNNSHIRDFRELRGFYPNLAAKIIQNAPYEQVEDVLEIAGLSEGQQKRLQANMERFTVTAVEPVYNEGDDRYNPGVY
ncbi:MAG: photosystem II complex extrinsic protein PsbU [Cyanobacteriota bacterium]|nr:photosystem II complex extrinsic protein PsbU [Cyanobacteriota bacterium]